MRDHRSRPAFAAATVTLTLIFGLSSQIGTAVAAGTRYPADCVQRNITQWSKACWLAIRYDTYGSDVLAGQYVLKDTGHSPGSIDGRFGYYTEKAVRGYQSANGLTVDGVVGSITWGSFQKKLAYSGISDTYGDYYNVGGDGLRFYNEDVLLAGYYVLDSGGRCDPNRGYFAMAHANCVPN